MTSKELREKAGELEIVGRWKMNVIQLLEAITKAELKNKKEEKNNKVPQFLNTTIINMIDDTREEWDEVAKEQNTTNDKVVKTYFVNGEKREALTVKSEVKQKFIQDAPIGALIAFEIGGKVRSAKITNRNTSRKLLKLESKSGRVYIIPYESVLWVRKGSLWPKPIFEMLIGGNSWKSQ